MIGRPDGDSKCCYSNASHPNHLSHVDHGTNKARHGDEPRRQDKVRNCSKLRSTLCQIIWKHHTVSNSRRFQDRLFYMRNKECVVNLTNTALHRMELFPGKAPHVNALPI